MKKLCYIYARKSVATGQGESIQVQLEMSKNTIRTLRQNEDIEFREYIDEGFSGKNTDRPEYQSMMSDITLYKPSYVVCYKLDRISRSVSDFSNFIDELHKNHTEFVSVNDRFDTSTANGKAMMQILAVFAEFERKTIALRVRDNMHALAQSGRWLGGTAPTGFVSAPDNPEDAANGRKSPMHLEEKTSEMNAVRTMFKVFSERKSLVAVMRYLCDNGFVSRKGKEYSLLGIKEILMNPVYCTADLDSYDYFNKIGANLFFTSDMCDGESGLMSYNKRDYSKGKGNSSSFNPVDKWIIAIGKHKGIVSGKDWVTVQNIIAMNKPDSNVKNQKNEYSLLSGMIYCSSCGSKMFTKHRSGKDRKSYQFDYVCQTKNLRTKNVCSCPNLDGYKTDDFVCAELMKWRDPNSDIGRQIEALRSDAKLEERNNPVKPIEKEITACDEKLQNFLNTIASGKCNDVLLEMINAEIEKLTRQKEELTDKLSKLREEMAKQESKRKQLDIVSSTTLDSFKKGFNELTINEKQDIIRLLIKRIEWDGENLRVFIYGE